MTETGTISETEKSKEAFSNLSSSDVPVYVRYKDHILFKNLADPIEEPMERETIGWLTKQTDEIMLIEHDRTISNIQFHGNRDSGLVILKSCIIKIHTLPLQESSGMNLNSQSTKERVEYALQPKKRKTPRTNKKGATK
jgi:hypothetical protein